MELFQAVYICEGSTAAHFESLILDLDVIYEPGFAKDSASRKYERHRASGRKKEASSRLRSPVCISTPTTEKKNNQPEAPSSPQK